ncbi:MAG: pilus assembly protein PilM [Lachnospirales bacterium]
MGLKELLTKEIDFNKNKKTTYLSFDFSNFDIKIVRGYCFNNKLNILSTYLITFDDEIYDDGKILEYDAVLNAISKEIKDNSIKVKDCIFTINTTDALIKTFDVPKLYNEEDQMNAIEYEVLENFPGDLSDYILEYRITQDNQSTCSVLACAVPRILIDEKKRLFKDLGLRLKYLDISTNTISKLIRFSIDTTSQLEEYSREEKEANTIAVIDISSAVLNIGIFTAGHIEFQRNIGNSLFKKNKNLLYISSQEEVNSLANINNDSELKDDFSLFLDEIEKSFKYYTSKGLGNAIDEIYLYGYDFAIQDFVSMLSERFSTPVFKIDRLNGIIDENIDVSMYVVAIGSLIRIS